MLKLVMSAMWYPWIAIALLSVAVPLTVADAAQPALLPEHLESPSAHSDSPAAHPDSPPAHPDPPTAHPDSPPAHADPPAAHPDPPAAHPNPPAAHPDSPPAHPDPPKSSEGSVRASQRTLDRGASELVWRNWLQSPESRDPAAPPRRITPKSVFITPHNCPEGKRLSGNGCITVVTVGKDEHEKYILEQLNRMVEGSVVYDYDETPAAPLDTEGPLQLNLPLGPSPPHLTPAAAASQNMPTRLPVNINKKNDKKPEHPEADLEAQLEKLKLEIDRIKSSNNHNKQQTHVVHDEHHKVTFDKPKRDNGKVNDTASVSDQEQGQKEVVFGNVSEDTVQFMTLNETAIKDIKNMLASVNGHNWDTSVNETIAEQPKEIHNDTKLKHIAEHPPKGTFEASTKTEELKVPETSNLPDVITTTQPTHNLEDNEKPSKLHPEVDYSDIGAAVKLISRYAEVTTDDMFKSEQKKYTEEEGPLGTRTKLQHRRRQRPADAELLQPSPGEQYVQLYPPPPPPPSVYDDRVPSHIIYPKTANLNQNKLNYQHYSAQVARYPLPHPNYPFRHIQEYWARPEQYLGPYAHGNPRRHHHSVYSQPPRRTRRPDPAYPAYYRLLGLQHWFSGDGAAER